MEDVREIGELLKKHFKNRVQRHGVKETKHQLVEDQQHEGRDREVIVVESWSTLIERTARNAKDRMERETGARSAGVFVDARSVLKSRLDGEVDYDRHMQRIESALRALQIVGMKYRLELSKFFFNEGSTLVIENRSGRMLGTITIRWEAKSPKETGSSEASDDESGLREESRQPSGGPLVGSDGRADCDPRANKVENGAESLPRKNENAIQCEGERNRPEIQSEDGNENLEDTLAAESDTMPMEVKYAAVPCDEECVDDGEDQKFESSDIQETDGDGDVEEPTEAIALEKASADGDINEPSAFSESEKESDSNEFVTISRSKEMKVSIKVDATEANSTTDIESTTKVKVSTKIDDVEANSTTESTREVKHQVCSESTSVVEKLFSSEEKSTVSDERTTIVNSGVEGLALVLGTSLFGGVERIAVATGRNIFDKRNRISLGRKKKKNTVFN